MRVNERTNKQVSLWVKVRTQMNLSVAKRSGGGVKSCLGSAHFPTTAYGSRDRGCARWEGSTGSRHPIQWDWYHIPARRRRDNHKWRKHTEFGLFDFDMVDIWAYKMHRLKGIGEYSTIDIIPYDTGWEACILRAWQCWLQWAGHNSMQDKC